MVSLAKILRVAKDAVTTDQKFSRLGLDSAMIVYFMMELEEKLGLELSPDDFYDHRRPLAISGPEAGRAKRRIEPRGPGPDMETFSSLVTLLAHRAATQPERRAYVFLGDRGAEEAALTFRELYDTAQALAAQLSGLLQRGDRAVLVFPPGLEFIVAFFGCLIAGVIAVPMMPPRRQSARDSSAAIVADCAPAIVLTGSADVARDDRRARFPGSELPWLAVDLAARTSGTAAFAAVATDDVAFLQYTSGSTSQPKGVAVSHANLLANLEMIRISLGNTGQSTYVNWVPLYHDMGLILNALQTLYVGALCVLMAPNAFMQRPLNWLRAIHTYRAEVGCSPNFGYDLCVSRYRADQMQGIDLSSWKVALNGAEPVRAETIRRFGESFAAHGFGPDAAFPAYGMAEATLLIAGGTRGAGHVTRQVSIAGLQAHAAPRPGDGDRRPDPGGLRPRAGSREDRNRRSRRWHAPSPPTWSARSGSAAPTSRVPIGATARPREPD